MAPAINAVYSILLHSNWNGNLHLLEQACHEYWEAHDPHGLITMMKQVVSKDGYIFSDRTAQPHPTSEQEANIIYTLLYYTDSFECKENNQQPIDLNQLLVTEDFESDIHCERIMNVIAKSFDSHSFVGFISDDRTTITNGVIKYLAHYTLSETRDCPMTSIEAINNGVSAEMINFRHKNGKNKRLGWIKVKQFQTGTAKEVESQIKRLKQERMERLVLDFTDNPGGNSKEALNLIKLLSPKSRKFVKSIIIESNNKKITKKYGITKGLYDPKQITVLVNSWSGSASENVSGALKDEGCLVISESPKTYGKGIRQYPYAISELNSKDKKLQKYTSLYTYITEKIFANKSGESPQVDGVTPHLHIYLQETDYPNQMKNRPNALPAPDLLPVNSFHKKAPNEVLLNELREYYQEYFNRNPKLKDVGETNARLNKQGCPISLHPEKRREEIKKK